MDDARQRRLAGLFHTHADAVHGYVAQRIGRHDAADVVSETFLIAWRKLETIKPGAERAWLFGVARRETLNHVRRRGRRVALYERLLSADVGAEGDPADEVVARAEVRRALATLRETDRDVLLTTLWTDLTPAQAAQVLGYSRATYAVRLHRARGRFARALSGSTTEADRAVPAVPLATNRRSSR